ncbi:hypothetical protein [Cytobacillus massiliigabonensis]|uniref:hypothetical protein n=1 Tax=Cytobacillus massiliigabonensis TaxID=1871011 RepID=UPI000C819925|nr:hypothetical protein [Cytobacillus massiliigabonensis]
MKIVNEIPLSVLKEQRENQENIPLSLDALGLALVQEKLDHAQTKELVTTIGQQLVKANLRLAALEGGTV